MTTSHTLATDKARNHTHRHTNTFTHTHTHTFTHTHMQHVHMHATMATTNRHNSSINTCAQSMLSY